MIKKPSIPPVFAGITIKADSYCSFYIKLAQQAVDNCIALGLRLCRTELLRATDFFLQDQ